MVSTSRYSSKSSSHFFTNTFIFLIFLLLLTFIPSQPPHFVKDTIFTTFWELIYLFLVGIVVCYGLFSRRNGKLENVTCDVSASYVPEISYVSSFFENGVGNAYGYGEIFDFDEFRESRSSRLRNGFFQKNEWNSKCFGGGSMVFVGNGNYEVKPENGNGCRPLNLPVRSLKSRIVDIASNGDDTNLEASDKLKKVKFRGLVPINLDDKFREAIVSSPLPWGSRSERMELRENVGEGKPAFVAKTELVHPTLPNVKPLSTVVLPSEMGEFERKESLRVSFTPATQSSLAQLKSKTLYRTSSNRRFSFDVVEKNVGDIKPTFVGEAELVRPRLPTEKPLSTAVLTSKVEEFGRKESLGVSFPPASKSSLAQLRSKPSSRRSSSRGFSTEAAIEKINEDNMKGFGKDENRSLLNTESIRVVSSNLDVQPATLVKERSISGSFFEMTLENMSKNDFKGSSHEGQKEESMCKEDKCIESSNLDVRHASLVEGQLQNGLTSEMSSETSSSDSNLKGSDKRAKRDLLRRQNTSYDFWNLDLNSASLVEGRCSTASSSVINGERKSETISMDFSNHKKEDVRRKKNGSIDLSKPAVKPKTTVKGLTRGKSVRTIRSNEISMEVKQREEVYSSEVGEKFIKHCDEDVAGLLKKSDWIDGLKSEADEHGRNNRDKHSGTKNSKSRKHQNRERQKNGNSSLVKSESIFMDSENFQVIADKEERTTCITGDTLIDSNEVDKKASEFIAKFREQIRLQRVA